MRNVQAEIERLRQQISQERAVLDAQQEDSPYWHDFRRNIHFLTGQLLRWRELEPRLAELDADIRQTQFRLREAKHSRDASNAMSAAKVLGFGGLLILIVLLLWPSPPGLLIALCILLLLAAGGMLWVDSRGRQARDQLAESAQLDLNILRKKWQGLVPDGRAWLETENAPVPVAGQGAFEDELQDVD